MAIVPGRAHRCCLRPTPLGGSGGAARFGAIFHAILPEIAFHGVVEHDRIRSQPWRLRLLCVGLGNQIGQRQGPRSAPAPSARLGGARGAVKAGLTVERSGAVPVVRVNAAVLDAVLATARQLARQIESSPPTIDGLLALKGVMEVSDTEENEEERRSAEAAVTKGFAEAIGALALIRRHEGAALGHVLMTRLSEIGVLAARADQSPGRQPEAIRARLAEQIATLLAQSERFDPDRLHQAAILSARKGE